MNLKSYIWYEKYRPKFLDEMILKPEHRKIFNQYIEERNIPHLLLYGPAGSGKTTISYILIEELGAQFLVLNASSADRGIDSMRGKVTQFAASMPMPGCLKIILLDEADSLTQEAMFSLKNTIETYNETCRFIFTANHPEKIIPEIHSRCVKFEFNAFPKDLAFNLINNILKQENCKGNKEDIEKLINHFYPDIRSIINNLQLGCESNIFNLKTIGLEELNTKVIEKFILSGDVRKIRILWVGTNNFLWLYKFLFDEFVPLIKEENRTVIALIIADYLYKDSMVVDKEINATACLVQIIMELGGKVKL
jgi:DNA polymerase III delta prime subunit